MDITEIMLSDRNQTQNAQRGSFYMNYQNRQY